MNQARFRKSVFDSHKRTDAAGYIYLICAGCGMRINPAKEKWEADHRARKALGENDHVDVHDPKANGQVLCKVCHAEKTKDDVKENAKGKAVSDKHFGIARKRGFRR